MKESIKETMDWLIFLGPQQIHKDGQKSPFEAGEGEKRWQRETKIEKLVEKSMQVWQNMMYVKELKDKLAWATIEEYFRL